MKGRSVQREVDVSNGNEQKSCSHEIKFSWSSQFFTLEVVILPHTEMVFSNTSRMHNGE